jgi:hypothetical protein
MMNQSNSRYDLYARCLLALVGMGDVNVLRNQLDLGKGSQIDLDAYAYALAGAENLEGKKVLENMKDHQEKQVRDAVNRALQQLEQWEQQNQQSNSTTSSDSNTYLNRHIASQGHLIQKLKAKDSTGRWAYYFVLIHPAAEERFLQALKQTETIDLEDYGEVIASCYGESPDEKTKTFLKERYGFEV